MSEHESQPKEFETRAREVFQDSLVDIDGRTQSRLTQARHRALQELESPKRSIRWAPAAGAVAASVLAVWFVIGLGPDVQNVQDSGMLASEQGADLELLLAEEELDMIEELEFYAWLDDTGVLEGQGDVTDGVG